MTDEVMINAEACYQQAEEKAEHYFQTLYNEVSKQRYAKVLTEDFHSWKHNHIRHHSLLALFSSRKKRASSKGYHSYLQWLDHTGKLDNYLDRSVSYLYMRDLGKSLNSDETQTSIRRTVNSWKNSILLNREGQKDLLGMAGLYRKAQEEGIELSMIWLLEKLRIVSENIPEGMDKEHAQRKLIKIIAGVLMHVLEELDDNLPFEERSKKLDEAIRLGYCYGLTYPFIDDLLDAKLLSVEEASWYTNLIRTTLTTGVVPELGVWTGENEPLIRFIHQELGAAFEYIKAHQQPESIILFFEQSYVFFQSQEVDRQRDLSNATYTNKDLYVPVILKSSSSRLIARSVVNASEDEGFSDRTFFYGIYNQLADDFADMFDDFEDGAVTPYTYYLKYKDQRKDLINPFQMYWTVIYYLIHEVFQSDKKSCEVILDRAVNGLKRYKERLGTEKYNEVMEMFALDDPNFHHLIKKMVRKADDVDFFDKLLRDHIITSLRNERKEQEEFTDTIEEIRNEINRTLHILPNKNVRVSNQSIIEAANYSLEGDGKRLRSIMTWVVGIQGFGLRKDSIVPLLRSLEYLHTASLIFDDLPTQDNSNTRRGRPTLHRVYNTAVAEITGLFLTQKAIEEQASLESFESKTVVKLIQYSAQMTEIMCQGQAMDLGSKGKELTIDQLNHLSMYKTGLAFEASLIMPAILAQASETEMAALKKYAHHAGIAFQIKDDLLDVVGDENLLGKPIGQDIGNNNSTFVSVLGKEEAKKEMWRHYCDAIEALQEIPQNIPFLKHLLNYIVNRNH
ncbi:polyprenyl synthetase family protein [Robertmurraya korlensis]|uniref:polyprenyl synthetase family protein n=1 Tax=Robertmurraya korlensis TaxID=519977 RepID=UPI00082698DB|nr:polyprenyl synthetase family protein [Robertmurraya korlensis]